MSTIGYARVSSRDQSLDSQIEHLTALGCERIFAEKVSGKSAHNREQLKAMLDYVQPGDTVAVVRLDRVARSVVDLWDILDSLTTRGVAFKSINDAWLDTESPMGRFMITVVGAMAEFERSLILARTRDGIKRAQARGVKFGCKQKLDSRVIEIALTRVRGGEALKTVAKDVGVHWKTLSRYRRAA